MNKKLLWKIHGYTGLYAGVFIAFLSITGAAALFRFEIDAFLNPEYYHIQKKQGEVTLNGSLERILTKYPDMYLFEVELMNQLKGALNFRLKPEHPDKTMPMMWEVFVHPYSGEEIGARNYFQTFSYFLRNIHVRFYEGWYGRQIVGLAGIALLITTVTGFMIYGRFMKKLKFGQFRKQNMRIWQADLHKFIGIIALAFNLVIAITGAWLGLQPLLMTKLNISQPNTYESQENPWTAQQDRNHLHDLNKVFEITRRCFPQLVPVLLRPTVDGQAVVSVMGDVPGQVFERRTNKLTIDKRNYDIVQHYNVNEQQAGSKLYYVQEALHFGDYGGWPLKLFYALLGLTSGFMALSGFIIYSERIKGREIASKGKYSWKRKLIFWLSGMLLFCLVMAVMSMSLSIAIPSGIVSALFYGLLGVLLIKKTVKIVIKRYHAKKTQTIQA